MFKSIHELALVGRAQMISGASPAGLAAASGAPRPCTLLIFRVRTPMKTV